MDTDVIRAFQDNPDNPGVLDGLSPKCQALLIDNCYTALFQKRGNQPLAALILQHFGQIQVVANSFVYTGPTGLSGYQALKRQGVAIIPVLEPEQIPKIRERFVSELQAFPEYRRSETDPDVTPSGNPIVYVLGGFAALGNPASFHNMLVRELRTDCYRALLPLFRTLIRRSAPDVQRELKLQVLFDRMMYRQVSQQPVAEAWHRDVAEADEVLDTDEIFGGWINLDQEDQYLSFIPGSHLGVRLAGLETGFARIPPDQITTIGAYRQKIRIPAGHLAIFPQYILHEVVAQKAKHNMMRLFTGWRLTTSDRPMNYDLQQRMDTQAIMRIPGGMYPPMYAANHGSFFLWKQFRPVPDRDIRVNTIEWSRDTMQLRTLIDRPAKGERPAYQIVPRYMASLKYYQDAKSPEGPEKWMYPLYTSDEAAIYRPHRIT
jgi:hypothetical protein